MMGNKVSFKLAWRAIRQNLLTSWITVFTVALAGGLFLGHGKPINQLDWPLPSRLADLMRFLGREGRSCNLC